MAVLIFNACACVLLAWALWHGRRWAWWTALVFIAPQVLAVSSPLFAWESYVGLRFGFYLEPRFNLLLAPFAVYWSVGAAILYGVGQPSAALLAEFHVEDGTQPFVVIDFVAALVLLAPVAAKSQQDRQG